ncbi:hypothetical protein AALP_AA8G197000 [Arabis alpina]|uniref:Uncharacterized protein n=1 Tax=Arabis alpina TaxID=50452 RepID=A0A087G850_ARAAL|nr:hypothetical protein AALP_AA8G197000 [Arabis alpina]
MTLKDKSLLDISSLLCCLCKDCLRWLMSPLSLLLLGDKRKIVLVGLGWSEVLWNLW